ncbi:MAG: DNA replication/repair protein RecF [Chitinophagales bacterium]
MFLRQLRLLNFKNHSLAEYQFSKPLNCFIGRNGAGKTNLLDAIHYLGLTKSFLNHIDQQLICFGTGFFRLEARITDAPNTHQLVIKVQQPRRKEFTVDDLTYKKLSDHIGKFPVVAISPDDSALIQGPGEERRRFLDNTLSQTNHTYLEQLMMYHKVLEQRNAYLKQVALSGVPDEILLEQYDDQLAASGEPVFLSRSAAVAILNQLFHAYYQLLAPAGESVDFTYSSDLHQGDLRMLLRGQRKKDLALERTATGIHRDDLEFSIGRERIRKFGSQGQQKSFILALKLAQCRYIAEQTGRAPFLMIDDLFDKLDQHRSGALLDILTSGQFPQVFITDTSAPHIHEALKGKEDLYEIFQLN